MAGHNENFGFDPEDFDRFAREAADGLRQVFGRFVSEPAASSVFSTFVDATSGRRTKPEPPTAGEVGAGVWAVFDVDDRGDARVEQVFATEIDALRANQHNTDPRRRVRFLPYGIAVSALGGSAIAADNSGSEDEDRGGAAGESADS
ncbi:hypothetical protein GPOL_c31620 [Gordonia polyisoprenivorans VH2]|uniref:Transmembrane protein n=2 Tax=Gordonia polyisoprenivorans TaxID=84595 RepID=H6MWH2_GORPV|nr:MULTISPECIES: hypothetical protein [Gordonia]AFA74177.1 hypothetical protein GPOL_c31620 [Gordonia polyisoprenivorans VH2]MBE7193682.1 hypothetical protein [Gordonia polyisoprenivorans]MDF3283775.1 hypothetical protein [Gordonia sp. N1V]NKY03806.1 hypothetical protein [Gordonia polyisoprenivorans]OZC31289.1 hypothetical protein CJJ17_07225 [Gordonia polyisoprenivorans]